MVTRTFNCVPHQPRSVELYPTATPPEASEAPNSPSFALFDGEVVEVHTAETPNEINFPNVEPRGDMIPATLYSQIIDCLQDGSFDSLTTLSPLSDSSEDLDDLMEFLHNDGFSADFISPTEEGTL